MWVHFTSFTGFTVHHSSSVKFFSMDLDFFYTETKSSFCSKNEIEVEMISHRWTQEGSPWCNARHSRTESPSRVFRQFCHEVRTVWRPNMRARWHEVEKYILVNKLTPVPVNRQFGPRNHHIEQIVMTSASVPIRDTLTFLFQRTLAQKESQSRKSDCEVSARERCRDCDSSSWSWWEICRDSRSVHFSKWLHVQLFQSVDFAK